MFEVDEELYSVFSQVGRERYLQRKIKQFSSDYPDRFACAGEENVRRFILLTLEKGEKYNMQADREVNGLSTLMYFLGCDFDINPLFPWARFKRFADKNLTKRHEEPESFVHLQSVYDKFLDFFTITHGQSLEHLQRALQRTQSITFQALLQPRSEKKILDALRITYPQRYEQVPETGIVELIQQARHKSSKYGLDANIGSIIFTLLAFFYGVNFETDPLYATILTPLHKEYTFGQSKEEQLVNHLHKLIAAQLQTFQVAQTSIEEK